MLTDGMWAKLTEIHTMLVKQQARYLKAQTEKTTSLFWSKDGKFYWSKNPYKSQSVKTFCGFTADFVQDPSVACQSDSDLTLL